MPAGIGTVSRFVTAIDTVSALLEGLKVCDALNDHGHWASASTANCKVACVFEAAAVRQAPCQPMRCSGGGDSLPGCFARIRTSRPANIAEPLRMRLQNGTSGK